MTDTTAARPGARPGNDVIAAVVLAFALVIGGAVALATAGGDDATLGAPAPGASEPAPEPTGPAPAPAGGECSYPAGEKASKDVGTPPAKPLPVGGRKAVLQTSAGAITLTLASNAPCTTSSFAFLAGKGYFDNTPCHRLTTQGIFVLQCGDPTGQGTGGPGFTLPDEALEGATYKAGTVAMANTGQPGSGGSQFFLVYDDTDLPPSYTPWATVTGGLDVLKAIAAAGSEPEGDGAPKKAVTIQGVTIS